MTTADTTVVRTTAADEVRLVETLHDLTMSKKGGDAVIARGMKALMPAALRWLNEEKARGTDVATLATACAHLVISLHFSLLLNLVRGAKALVPVLPDVIAHVKGRYDVTAAKLRAEVETKP